MRTRFLGFWLAMSLCSTAMANPREVPHPGPAKPESSRAPSVPVISKHASTEQKPLQAPRRPPSRCPSPILTPKPRDLTPKLSNRFTAADPEFSPDGKRIAYSLGDRLLSVRVNGTGSRLLIPPRKGSSMTFADPTYSPDGHSLLFSIVNGRSSLHRIDLRRLRALPNPLVEPHVSVRSPAWLTRPG